MKYVSLTDDYTWGDPETLAERDRTMFECRYARALPKNVTTRRTCNDEHAGIYRVLPDGTLDRVAPSRGYPYDIADALERAWIRAMQAPR